MTLNHDTEPWHLNHDTEPRHEPRQLNHDMNHDEPQQTTANHDKIVSYARCSQKSLNASIEQGITPGDTYISLRMVIFRTFFKANNQASKICLVTGFKKSAEIAILRLIGVSQEKRRGKPSYFQNIQDFKVKNIHFEGFSLCY